MGVHWQGDSWHWLWQAATCDFFQQERTIGLDAGTGSLLWIVFDTFLSSTSVYSWLVHIIITFNWTQNEHVWFSGGVKCERLIVSFRIYARAENESKSMKTRFSEKWRDVGGILRSSAESAIATIPLKCTPAVQAEHHQSTEYWSVATYISVIFWELKVKLDMKDNKSRNKLGHSLVM